MTSTSAEPFGYLLITTDPELTSGSRGDAHSLIQARLRKGLWPIYSGTRNRERIMTGALVAFYVAGSKSHAGHIVATARVLTRRLCGPGMSTVDPAGYLTEAPAIALGLDEIHLLQPPIDFREKLPLMSFRPTNMKKWGTILMGGTRALSKRDWELLFRVKGDAN